jgi:hypothetical protein
MDDFRLRIALIALGVLMRGVAGTLMVWEGQWDNMGIMRSEERKDCKALLEPGVQPEGTTLSLPQGGVSSNTDQSRNTQAGMMLSLYKILNSSSITHVVSMPPGSPFAQHGACSSFSFKLCPTVPDV